MRLWSGRLVPLLREVLAVLQATIRRFSDQEGMHLAAGIAYYALLSIFPLALLIVSIFSFFVDADEVVNWVIERFGEETPVSLEFLKGTIERAIAIRGFTGLVGILGTVLSSTLVFAAVMRSVNRAWGLLGTGTRSFWRRKLWEFTFLAALACLFLLSFAAASVFEVLRDGLDGSGLWLATGNFLWTFIFNVVTVGGIAIILLLLYKYVPTTKVRWREALLPALLVAVAFKITNILLSWYVSSLGYYNAVYGSLASIVVLMLWIYVIANILIIGAALSAVLADRWRPRARADIIPVR